MILHLNKKNKPTIVDISQKKQTTRIAKAEGIIQFSKNYTEFVLLTVRKKKTRRNRA